MMLVLKKINFLFYCLILLLLFVWALPSASAITDAEKQEFFLKNIVPNSGFENGLGSWTTSGGSLAITTTAANVASGQVALSFDPSAGSQVAENADIAIPPGLYGANCALFVKYKGGGTANITIEANNGSTLGTAITVSSAATNYTVARSQFTCPTSGSLHVELTSAGDAAALYIDDIFIGLDVLETFGGGGGGTFQTPANAGEYFFSFHFYWNSGTPTTVEDIDSMISSYTDTSTGNVLVELNSVCTSTPFCTCSINAGGLMCGYRRTESDLDTLKILSTSNSGSPQDADGVIVNCRCDQ